MSESNAAYPQLTRWQRFCWWLAAALAPKDGSRYGPRIFGRRVKHLREEKADRQRTFVIANWLNSEMAAKPDFQEFRALIELHLGLTASPAGSGAPGDDLDIPFAASWF